jgi:integrase
MAVRQKGGRWVVEFEQSGVRVFRRLPAAATKAQAVQLETLLRRDLIEQKHLRKAPELTLEACVTLWLRDTLASKKDKRMPVQNAAHLKRFLEGRTLRYASLAARESMEEWSNAGLSPATINRRLALLKAALRHAQKTGIVEVDYGRQITMMREPPGREVYLTREEVKSLADAMESEEGRAAVLLLAWTGMRASELLAPSLSVTNTTITIPPEVTKTGKPRVVPVSPSASRLLSALPLGLSYRQLEWQWRAAREKVGMPHVHLHDLRHTCASWLVNTGVPLEVVGRILGHSVLQTTARYAHLSDDVVQKAMRKLK